MSGILTEKLPNNDMFQAPLAYETLAYAHSVLVYIMRRPDCDFSAPSVEEILRRHRSIPKAQLPRFYEIMSSIVRNLIRYSQLEDSVTKSGAYEKDRLAVLASIKAGVLSLEAKENRDVLNMLRSLCNLPIVK